MDQFGGPEGKKLKYSKFREILKSVGNRALAEQKEALVKELESWQGDLEQVDDICIIGIKF